MISSQICSERMPTSTGTNDRKRSNRVTQPDGFITVDKRSDAASRSQGLFERVTADQLAKRFSEKVKREVSDILWEFIPEGQSRIGRT
jgi:hypothetical protein